MNTRRSKRNNQDVRPDLEPAPKRSKRDEAVDKPELMEKARSALNRLDFKTTQELCSEVSVKDSAL